MYCDRKIVELYKYWTKQTYQNTAATEKSEQNNNKALIATLNRACELSIITDNRLRQIII